jgi:hypothetical protein
LERRSRKSPEKLRLSQPTERDRATFRPKEEEDDTWLWLGLSGGGGGGRATDSDFLLAAATAPALVAYGVEKVAWCA